MKGMLLAMALAGCALTSKSKPVDVRFFTPAAPQAVRAEQVRGPARAKLGRVAASSHLRTRIAHRRSAVEVDLADAQRWTEDPDAYVRRSLARALFHERGVAQAVTGDAPTLTVEVTAFEHVERGGRHFGAVELRYELDDDRIVFAADVVRIEHEARGDDITQLVYAIGAALEAASADVADRVVVELGRMP